MNYVEAMKQALEALEDPIAFAKGHAAITALRTAIAEAEKRVQLTVKDFVVTVGGIEDAVGEPVYWTEWPNRENT